MNNKSYFGKLKDGREVFKYHLKTDELEVNILNYGGIITEIYQKDRNGKKENIVLGFDNIEEYEEKSPHFGCITGRIAGRVASGNLEIDGIKYKLPINNGPNNIHGGLIGLDKRIWDVKELEDKNGIELSYTSPHLEEGLPGKVDFKVRYILEKNNLIIEYIGEADRKTFINLTNHTYFNLSGGKEKILNHKLKIDADYFMELDKNSIPVKKKEVTGSFDRRNGGNLFNISENEKDLKIVGGGLDHPFILDKKEDREIILIDDKSGRKLEVETSEPVVVVYSGNFLKDEGILSIGAKSEKYMGICLETQDYPDAPNQESITTRWTTPEKNYKAWTKYSFSSE